MAKICFQPVWTGAAAFTRLLTHVPFHSGKELTEGLPLALRRKLAVWAAAGGWLGIGRWPSAMPTIAVMWVSVPKTWMGIPVVFPVDVHKSSQPPQGEALPK